MADEQLSEAEERAQYNLPVIEEFRANGGAVGGGGSTMLLLHHTGARSGTERVNPLAYQAVGDRFAIFASNAGREKNPDWYHNLVAHPRTTIEVGTEVIEVIARVAGPDERDPIWEQQKADAPGFAEYEKNAPRQIPVVLLERA